MRGTVTALLLASLTAAAGAQIPIRRPAPFLPQPLPKQPLVIQQQQEYQRMRVSFETYSLVNVVTSSGFANGAYPVWASVGIGSRSEYRLTPHFAATMDATSSMLGGPANIATLELGTRYRPEASSGRFSPFVDVRASYIYTYYQNFFGYSEFVPQGTLASRFTTGVGALGGGGFEYALSRSWTLTSAFALTVSSMQQQRMSGDPATPHFTMTTFRYSAGFRWNPVRMVSRDVQ